MGPVSRNQRTHLVGRGPARALHRGWGARPGRPRTARHRRCRGASGAEGAFGQGAPLPQRSQAEPWDPPLSGKGCHVTAAAPQMALGEGQPAGPPGRQGGVLCVRGHNSGTGGRCGQLMEGWAGEEGEMSPCPPVPPDSLGCSPEVLSRPPREEEEKEELDLRDVEEEEVRIGREACWPGECAEPHLGPARGESPRGCPRPGSVPSPPSPGHWVPLVPGSAFTSVLSGPYPILSQRVADVSPGRVHPDPSLSPGACSQLHSPHPSVISAFACPLSPSLLPTVFWELLALSPLPCPPPPVRSLCDASSVSAPNSELSNPAPPRGPGGIPAWGPGEPTVPAPVSGGEQGSQAGRPLPPEVV